MDKAPRNVVFAALLACLVNMPDVVQQRGPASLHCFRELAVRCLIKLTKQLQLNRDDNVRLVFSPCLCMKDPALFVLAAFLACVQSIGR